MLRWFSEFNDQQRNVFLHKMLDVCDCAQLHLLSVEMEDNLHKTCPHNCQDLLSWLPPAISFRILSLLDPVSLCQASQVSTGWSYMAAEPRLWMGLCKMKEWQLSDMGERKQRREFGVRDGTRRWKEMFAERFRVRRNWLQGRYTVRTFEGHSQGISCVQFDEQRIVSGSSDKTIKVWDIRTNKPWSALTLAGHSATVRCLHLSGDRLVSGSADRTIKVWDLKNTGKDWSSAACRVTMIGHMHTVRCLQVDENKVVSGSYDRTLKVWDLSSGQCHLTLRGHEEAVLCVQFNERKIVSGSADRTIKVLTGMGFK
ncbi:uncharacterized protein LOC134196990 isoform X2 [Corticium candelabrum]|uniref:uncharacterized protein LOC134196990 isoform X2 n=1 Tax=Corticium candelabrum TaxID=121492 RepID=UPI002E267EE4|nr:uncharacterized protein LOC134196990 isoform X2 [Corticium candelabrum]